MKSCQEELNFINKVSNSNREIVMFGRSLVRVTNTPMMCILKVDNNNFQEVEVKFGWVYTKLAKTTYRPIQYQGSRYLI